LFLISVNSTGFTPLITVHALHSRTVGRQGNMNHGGPGTPRQLHRITGPDSRSGWSRRGGSEMTFSIAHRWLRSRGVNETLVRSARCQSSSSWLICPSLLAKYAEVGGTITPRQPIWQRWQITEMYDTTLCDKI